MTETLSGSIEHITFHNPENGFAVLKIRAKGYAELVPVVGYLTVVNAGEFVEAKGSWAMDRAYGRQFKADEMQTTHPASLEGIERYLGSGVVKGIGPKLAERIVEVFGDQTLRILDEYPEMLTSVQGIGRQSLEKIRDSWNEQKHVRSIMLFLHSHGIGSARAVRIYRRYGESAISLIKENPYRLADEIRGIGFRTADELAQKLGIPHNSPHRARAALIYVLHETTRQGHCGFPTLMLVEQTAALLEVEENLVQDAVEFHLEQETILSERVDGDDWLFLKPLHQAEVGIAEAVNYLLNHGDHPFPAEDIAHELMQVERRLKITLADSQREAIELAFREKVIVITGGPGVGKTTLVKSLLELFEERELKCVLAAPTGRAAKRLEETTGRTAKTIHRLLEFDPISRTFNRNPERQLKGDLFVLDETSMIDVPLAFHCLVAIPEDSVLVLVGDIDQLPSVGPGTVLKDLIESQVIPVVRLTEIFRQAGESQIVRAAFAINHNEPLPLEPPANGLSDFYFTECNAPDAIERMLLKVVTERIPERFGFDPVEDVQVLTPMNRTTLGARNLNQVFQESLNPLPEKQEKKAGQSAPEIQRFGTVFRVHDKVIQTENNYEREVFNGDIGRILRIDQSDQELTVRFEQRDVIYDFNSLDELSLAYVLTIHKSQGSEYPCVVIPVHTQHFVMLRRNLIYTGITRGKRLVVLVGSLKALQLAVSREDTNSRYTMLRRRLHSL